MEFHFIQTSKHLQDLSFNYLKGNRLLIIFLCIIAFSLFFNLTTTIAYQEVSLEEAILTWIIPLVLTTLIWIVVFRFIRSRRLKGKDGKMATGERHISLLEDKIVVQTPVSEGAFKWEIVSKLRQSKMNYFIYLGRFQAIVIPKEAFTSVEQQQAFEQLVHSKIKH